MPKALLKTITKATSIIPGKKGYDKIKEANQIEAETQKIHEMNLSEFEAQHQRMLKTLGNLGRLENEIVVEFEKFVTLFEKIHSKPEFKSHEKNGVTLPQFDIQHIRDLARKANKSKVADFATMAAIGSNMLFFAPALSVNLLLGGVFLNFKGEHRKKQAEETRESVKRAEVEIKHSIKYMKEIADIAKDYYMELYDTQRFYDRYLKRFIEVIEVKRKTDWNNFTEEEKLITENTVLLVNLLNRMCQVELLLANEEAETGSEINQGKLNDSIKDSKRITDGIKGNLVFA